MSPVFHIYVWHVFDKQRDKGIQAELPFSECLHVVDKMDKPWSQEPNPSLHRGEEKSRT